MSRLLRPLSMLLVAALSTVGLLAGIPKAVAAPRAATVVSLIAPTTVFSGGIVTARGTLKRVRLAKPIAGQRVRIDKRAAGNSTWVKAGTAVTRADGSYSVDVIVTRNIELRAVFSQTRSLKADVSSTRAVTASQSINVSAQGPSTVDAGEDVSLSGTASQGLRGTLVHLEQLRGSTWQRIGSVRVSSSGGFRVSGSTSVGGFQQSFRVRAVATRQIAGAVSTTYKFTVYAWYPLTSLKPLTSPAQDVQSNNFRPTGGAVSVGGQSYGNSWASLYSANGFSKFESGQAAFAPLTECTTLEMTMGIRDNAGANAAWQFLVYLDGNEFNYGYLTKGQNVPLTIDVTAVNRFKLANNRLVGMPDDAAFAADAVWAGARIKCAGQP